jgi:16S rRNA (guanine527-N7)-methyltransferase
MDERTQLAAGARALGIALDDLALDRLLLLLDELARWNRAYNLTAIVDRPRMITHHLLDSLSIHADIHGQRVADAGTGAGFPGVPLALCQPHRHFTLVDSNQKKIRFVSHVARALELSNVEAVHARIEQVTPQVPFDTVVARAFAALPELLEQVAPICSASTRVLAMKGKRPDGEIAAVVRPWRVCEVREVDVPGLSEARSLVVLQRT